MTTDTLDYLPGNLVRARGREWVVQADTHQGDGGSLLRLRPLGGADEDIITLIPELEFEPVTPATFAWPNPEQAGNHAAALLLRDALRLKLRAGGGPFRSFGNIAVEPRAYQLVPLLMALRLTTVRLLIADDVGIGKTIEAGLIARELIDRGEVARLAVLCPPHLVEQWQGELHASLTPSIQEIAYKGEQVSIKGTLRGQTLSVSQFDVQLPDQPQPIKLVGEFTLPLVPDGVPVKGHAVATFNVPQLTSLVDADLDWEDNQGQLVVMARAASISAIAFCTSRLLFSAIVTTLFSRASFITCCHWLTMAVASPCAPGKVAGTGASGR